MFFVVNIKFAILYLDRLSMSGAPTATAVKPGDADEIFAIIQESHRVVKAPIGPHWNLSQTREECSREGLVFCDASRKIQAFILYRDIGEAWEISFLATHPNARGQGLMGELMQEMIRLKPNGKAIWLEVHEENQIARRLYERLGFQMRAKRPKYYADGGAAVLYNYG